MRAKAAEPARRGPELDLTRADARQPDGSRALSAGHIAKRTEIGDPSCRPKGPFAISSETGNRHIFSETHCHNAHSGAMEMERQWLWFSPTTKKPSCQSSWLLGVRSAMQIEWANGVSGNRRTSDWRSNRYCMMSAYYVRVWPDTS